MDGERSERKARKEMTMKRVMVTMGNLAPDAGMPRGQHVGVEKKTRPTPFAVGAGVPWGTEAGVVSLHRLTRGTILARPHKARVGN